MGEGTLDGVLDFLAAEFLQFLRKRTSGARTSANPGAFMKGSIDDVRIYNRALTAIDITALNGLEVVY